MMSSVRSKASSPRRCWASSTLALSLVFGCGAPAGEPRPRPEAAAGNAAAPVAAAGSTGSSALPSAGATAGGAGPGVSAPAVGGSSGSAGVGGQSPRSKFEPEAGQTLLFIGQDTNEIESYRDALGLPAGVMLYSNVWDGYGVLQGSDFGGYGWSDLPHWHNDAAPFAVQIGLDLDYGQNCGSCQNCARAGHLEALAAAESGVVSVVGQIAEQLKALARPVLLRVGYEFDGEICPGGYGKYPYTAYQQAFRRVVEVMQQHGADNVAFVWSAWAFQSRDPSANAGVSPWDWYPGDDYVDWVGLSVFPGTSSSDPNEGYQADKRRQMAQFASNHHKPLMIGESAPRARFAPALGAVAWNGWFQGVFDYIEENDVKAFSYINMNWEALSMWTGRGWGDTRVQGSPIASQWQDAIASERFLQSSDELYGAMGFP